MNVGAITISTELDNAELEKKLQTTIKKIEALEDAIRNTESERLPLLEQSAELTARLDEAKAKLSALRTVADNTTDASELKRLKGEIAEQKQEVNALQSAWNSVQSGIERCDKKIEKASAELLQTKERAVDVAEALSTVEQSSHESAEATEAVFGKAKKRLSTLANRLKRMVMSAVVFSTITSAVTDIRVWMRKVVIANDEASASVARLKGEFLTLVQPLTSVIVPTFSTLVNTLSNVVEILARIGAAIAGATYENSKAAASALYDETNALTSVGKAAGKAEKQLASFDEINKLSFGTASATSDAIKPDFSQVTGLTGKLKEFVTDLEIKIQKLRFDWDNGEIASNRDFWVIAMTGVLGAVIGSAFGSFGGAAIGLALGTLIGIGIDGFEEGESRWTKEDALIVVLSSIICGVLGTATTGISGTRIGLQLGAGIAIGGLEFSEGDCDKNEIVSTLRVVLTSLLGLVLGAKFGGIKGGAIGLLLGLTTGLVSVIFDDTTTAATRAKAVNALTLVLSTIIGAVVGAAFGAGVFGGIVGGAIGLTLGFAINFARAKINNNSVNGSLFKSMLDSTVNLAPTGEIPIPKLATGAVIPPNREFLAVLGDQRSGTNIEAPLATIEQAVENVLSRRGGDGGGSQTLILECDKVQFAKLVYRANKSESHRIGVSLVEA